MECFLCAGYFSQLLPVNYPFPSEEVGTVISPHVTQERLSHREVHKVSQARSPGLGVCEWR